MLAETLASIDRQDSDAWRCTVVANRGATIPHLSEKMDLVTVDLPLPEVVTGDDQEAKYNQIRDDKGARILAGLHYRNPAGFVMVVDYDDLVSPRLAGLCERNPDAPGWFFDDGFLFSGVRLSYYYPHGFHELCGTSHIVQMSRLLPDCHAESSDMVRYRLGSHKFIKAFLEAEGAPLQRLPFAGAAYRVGHSQSVSSSAGLMKHICRRRDFARHPLRTARKLMRLRPYVPFKARPA